MQEYQSKKLMHKSGINIQKFVVADSSDSAEKLLRNFKAQEYVVKAQILSGGRGNGFFTNGFRGGIHITKNAQEIPSLVSKMIGFNLITQQTPEQGVTVNKVMIAEALDIARETYLAILFDRRSSCPMIIASPRGGVDIEEIARTSPGDIHREIIDLDDGGLFLLGAQASFLATKLGFTSSSHTFAAEQIKRLYKIFIQLDCIQAS
ncbi:unnamed protein product [Protopolystoma xenopodis]|uniref:ATP-grasp fold succinyl-CoA synthetase-type domain-containing protein n=1 Tax=Protopolystoma xenopodis TaxID=117903 RepID=A0A3S5A8S9_9PLAT|nr:unnamed protein product [Protopolystoma xenopodis]